MLYSSNQTVEVTIKQPMNGSVEIRYYKVHLMGAADMMQYIPGPSNSTFDGANITVTAMFHGVSAGESTAKVMAIDVCNQSSNKINVMCSTSGRLNMYRSYNIQIMCTKLIPCRLDHPSAISDDCYNCCRQHLVPLSMTVLVITSLHN